MPQDAYGTPHARPKVKIGDGIVYPVPDVETWTVEQILNVLGKGRSVMVIFDDATSKAKYRERLQQAALSVLGEPVTVRSVGQNYDQIYWSTQGETHGLSCGITIPEEVMMARPSKTDVVRIALPAAWL
jgi:hypothetical protein